MTEDRPTDDEIAAALDRAYPSGWRCGDSTTDRMTLLMARGLYVIGGRPVRLSERGGASGDE